jgi:hypothetical protein
MLETHNEVHCIAAHFVRRDFWLEIKCAEAAVTTASRVKFWVEIEDPLARKIDNPQVGKLLVRFLSVKT